MSQTQPVWWKLVVDSDGKVVSCELALAKGEDHNSTFFVLARDTRHAGRLAFNKYMLAITKARHTQYASEGKCRCGRERDTRLRRCSICREANKLYTKRSRARASGATELPPKAERRDVIAERKAFDQAALRLSILEEVNDVWTKRGTVGLRDWLRKQLAAQKRSAA